MYSSKDLIKKAEEFRKEGNLEVAGMLEHLNQLKFSYIPQLHEKMSKVVFAWWTEEKFPHMIKYTPPVEPCKHNNDDE